MVGCTLVFNSYEPYCNRPTETRSTHSLSKQFQQRDTVFDKNNSIYKGISTIILYLKVNFRVKHQRILKSVNMTKRFFQKTQNRIYEKSKSEYSK